MSADIVALLLASLPDTVGEFLQARASHDADPFWLLEYSRGDLTLLVAPSKGAPLPEVRFGERTPECDFWLCGPTVMGARCMHLIHGSGVGATRAAIVACVEMFLRAVISL